MAGFQNGVKFNTGVPEYKRKEVYEYSNGGYKFFYTVAPEADPAVGDDIVVTPTANANEWTFTMPESDVELQPEYYTDLLESNDNSSLLTSLNGETADLWLGRTLQAGSYNTLALPFSMTLADFKTATGDDGILVKKLTEASVEGTTLNLTFGDAESIVANTPYLVKLSGSENVTLEGFDLVTVSTADGTASFTDVDFIPTLSRTQVAGNVKNILFLGANNELLNPSAANQYIKGFRAYFLLKGEAAAAARSFVLNFGDGEASGIQTIEHSPLNIDHSVYDLSGRRMANGQSSMVNGQSLKKGVYIVNGRKVVVR